jgi:phage terminase small subunit
MTETLTEKQKVFIQEYLVDLNATQAAIRAGYSENTAQQMGSENLSKPVIKEAIEKAQTMRLKRLAVTQDYVLSTIVDTIERCKQSAPVLDRKGNKVLIENDEGEMAVAYVYEPMAVLKGSELLGKHLSLFVDRSEISGPNGEAIKTDSTITITPEEAYKRLLHGK